MTARTWREGDPEPGLDVTAVVDPEGVTWARCRCNIDHEGDPPSRNWHEHQISHHPTGLVTGGSIENLWSDLFGHLPAGSTVREATAEEADTWIEAWLT